MPYLAGAAKAGLMRVFGLLKHLNREAFQERSWRDWLEQQVQPPQARQSLLASACISTLVHAPELLSADLALSLLANNIDF